jgi:hypothetical protein
LFNSDFLVLIFDNKTLIISSTLCLTGHTYDYAFNLQKEIFLALNSSFQKIISSIMLNIMIPLTKVEEIINVLLSKISTKKSELNKKDYE